MCNRNAHLLGNDRTGQSRVHISDHENAVRSVGLAALFKAQHDFRRLLGVRAASRTQELVGCGDPKFVEEHIVQLVVVVLAGMDDLEAQRVAVCAQRAHERSDFHEVGTGAGDQIKDSQRASLAVARFSTGSRVNTHFGP